MADPQPTKWIEYGLIACLIVVAIVGVFASLGPDLYRTFEAVRRSL